MMVPVASVLLPQDYLSVVGSQVRLSTPFLYFPQQGIPAGEIGTKSGHTAVMVNPLELPSLRTEASDPPATAPGWWTGDDVGLAVYYLGTQPAAEAHGRNVLFYSGVAFGVGASAFVGGVQECGAVLRRRRQRK